MTNNIPTAEEFCKELDDIHGMSDDVIQSHIDFAKLHVEAALKKAAKKAITDDIYVVGSAEDEDRLGEIDFSCLQCNVNEKSILEAYSLENVK
jgi:hypothetical protein